MGAVLTRILAGSRMANHTRGLTGRSRRGLVEALLAAFPTKSELEQVVSFGFNVDLEVVAGGTNLSQVAFNLVRWAENGDHVEKLVEAAREKRPDNPDLRAFAESLARAPDEAEQFDRAREAVTPA